MVYERTIKADDEKTLGHLRLGYRRTALAASTQKSFFIVAAGIVLAIVLVAIGIKLLISRIITTPITGMSQIASVMAAGDLSQEVPVKGKTEIDALGGAINAM